MGVATIVAAASSRLMDIVFQGRVGQFEGTGLTFLQGRVVYFAQGRVGLGTRCPTPLEGTCKCKCNFMAY